MSDRGKRKLFEEGYKLGKIDKESDLDLLSYFVQVITAKVKAGTEVDFFLGKISGDSLYLTVKIERYLPREGREEVIIWFSDNEFEVWFSITFNEEKILDTNGTTFFDDLTKLRILSAVNAIPTES